MAYQTLAWTPISLCLILLKYTRLARFYFWYFSSRWSCGTLVQLRPISRTAAVMHCTHHISKFQELRSDTGWQEHQSSSVLALLVVPQHSKPCSVGKVAFEVTYSLQRLLKGHLREVSCLFCWEVCSSRGEHPWRCCQQRLPVHPPRQKAAAAVVVTEKTLQTYWGNVTCAKEKQNQGESILLFQDLLCVCMTSGTLLSNLGFLRLLLAGNEVAKKSPNTSPCFYTYIYQLRLHVTGPNAHLFSEHEWAVGKLTFQQVTPAWLMFHRIHSLSS